jgi:hypothetical protein
MDWEFFHQQVIHHPAQYHALYESGREFSQAQQEQLVYLRESQRLAIPSLLARLSPGERETLRDWSDRFPAGPVLAPIAPILEGAAYGRIHSIWFRIHPLPFALGAYYAFVAHWPQQEAQVRDVLIPYEGRADLIERGALQSLMTRAVAHDAILALPQELTE